MLQGVHRDTYFSCYDSLVYDQTSTYVYLFIRHKQLYLGVQSF